MSGSTPSLNEFNPKAVPYQFKVIRDIRRKFNYDNGPHFVMLSGSIGSAKSILMAHLAVTHCLLYPKARVLLGRKTMPDLKDTILQKILDHIEGSLRDGIDYKLNETKAKITFSNGSEIISRSWADKKYKKFRSLEVSMILLEEITENTNLEKEFFVEMIGRLGRLPHIPENIFIGATNPDDPRHWAYEFFIEGSKTKREGYAVKELLDEETGEKHPNVHTYYSRTDHNPFLPKWYISSLKQKYDAKMIRRLLYGEWLYIQGDTIYYEYNPEEHYTLEDTKINKRYPIRISFDFNIGVGKPMSSCLFQYEARSGKFIFIDEVVIEGTRTKNVMEEYANRGYFELAHNPKIIIHGDAAGRHRDTRSNNSDYDIIEEYLERYVRRDEDILEYEIDVPRANPSIRDRHNIVNGQLKNANGRISILLDKRCKTCHEGLRKTKLKPNAGYIEQEDPWQHVTTAIGYGVKSTLDSIGSTGVIEI